MEHVEATISTPTSPIGTARPDGPRRDDVEALKVRQRAAWSAGDYAVVGTTLQIVGEQLCEAVDLRAGERVLDIAAGNGNASLAAARRFGQVTAIDYVPALLEKARTRAAVQGLPLDIRECDAERLPFAGGAFDVVLSTFGVMFTPDQEAAAREIVRVCRSGGRVGLACWTPDGFVGQLFKALGRHVPPPPGVRSAAEWGTAARLGELFGGAARDVAAERRVFAFRYASPAHWLEVFRTYYGPMHKAFAALAADRQEALAEDLLAVAARFDRGGGRGAVIAGDYLEVVVTLR